MDDILNFTADTAHMIACSVATSADLERMLGSIRNAAERGRFETTFVNMDHKDLDRLRDLGYYAVSSYDPTLHTNRVVVSWDQPTKEYTAGGWILCKSGILPKVGDRVIVQFGFEYDDTNIYTFNGEFPSNVIAWMPYPRLLTEETYENLASEF